MERMFGRPIVTQEQMRARIRELGRQISAVILTGIGACTCVPLTAEQLGSML